MEIRNVSFIRHLYHREKALRYYSTYKLKYVENGSKQLTDLIRIEDYRGYSVGSGFNHYLRFYSTSNWKTGEQVTGLKTTTDKNIFFGDRLQNGKKNLLLFWFHSERKSLIIDYFPNYYPDNDKALEELIKIHFTA